MPPMAPGLAGALRLFAVMCVTAKEHGLLERPARLEEYEASNAFVSRSKREYGSAIAAQGTQQGHIDPASFTLATILSNVLMSLSK